MNVIGIICEYNPFHNGHLYHINKVKELYPDSILICIVNGYFMQRGEVSILTKWQKAEIALNYGIDLVVELPFEFASQSADIFAKGAVEILKNLGADTLVFGSECNDIEKLTLAAKKQIESTDYNNTVKELLNNGENYPTAMSKALGTFINTPNDILGLCYIKEIILQKANITPVTIKRTNDYHSLDTNNNIISASAIRNLITENKDIRKFVPCGFKFNVCNYNKFFELLKYQIITNNNLSLIQTVDEGIENRILKYINTCNNHLELINKIKTKRYTYNKINRMFIHILTNFTKEKAYNISLKYIRILGFNSTGKTYLNKIKKNTNVPLIVKFDNLLNEELKRCQIYDLLTNSNTYELEYKSKPIIK